MTRTSCDEHPRTWTPGTDPEHWSWWGGHVFFLRLTTQDLESEIEDAFHEWHEADGEDGDGETPPWEVNPRRFGDMMTLCLAPMEMEACSP